LPIGEINRSIERLADAVIDTRRLIPGYIADHPEFRDIGENMMVAWEEGVGGF
jgi:serine/threonine-protein kinase HipA